MAIYLMQQIFNQMNKARHRKLIKSLCPVSLKKKLCTTALSLAGLGMAHTGAMVAFEDMKLGDAAWLSATTMTTVGYGDYSAKTLEGRLSTILLLYGPGIFLLAQAGGIYLDARQSKKDRLLNGKWKWNMDNHIVILNSPKNNPEAYLKQMVSEMRKSALPGSQAPIIVVSPELPNGISDELRKKDVAHVNSTVTDREAFDNSSLKEAGVIVILNKDESDPLADSLTFDLVSRARAENPKARIIAEAVSKENRERLLTCGADQVIRPLRSYPELLVRTILAPGAEQVMEDLFDTHGEECVRYDVSLKASWGQVATRLITHDIGLPLAYVNMSGQTVSNAKPSDMIEAKGVIAIVREGNHKPHSEVLQLLTQAGEAMTAKNDNIGQTAAKKPHKFFSFGKG